MKKVRFAPSPTGSLHVGNALSAVANRRLGDWMLLRIDDTDPARNVPGGEEAILRDLEWLGIEWDEGPVRQSERQERYREAAAPLAALGLPRHDVHYDLPRIRRLSVQTLEAMSDEELAALVDVPPSVAPVMRGARDLVEARAFADLVLAPPEPSAVAAPETLLRFR